MAGLYAGLLVKVYYMLLNQDKVFIFFCNHDAKIHKSRGHDEWR